MRRSVLDIFGRASSGLRKFASLLLIALFILALPQASYAQATTENVWTYFGTDYGDAYSSILFNQIFGPLFPSAAGGVESTLFSEIIAYFNMMILLVGGLMFFYNVTIGLLQSAHEGQVLGSRWSSMWSPLRVVFAVGLLVPVNEGYNLAQTGIAYIVRGATMMASNVWTATATAVLEDDIPVAAPRVEFSADLLYTMYQQAACMTVVGTHFAIAGGAAGSNGENIGNAITEGRNYVNFPETPVVDAVIDETNPASAIASTFSKSYISAINFEGGRVDEEICGSVTTPTTPLYIDNLLRDVYTDTSIEDGLMTREKAAQVAKAFQDGHQAILYNTHLKLRDLTDSLYIPLKSTTMEPASIKDKIAEIHLAANKDLSKLQDDIRKLATEDDLGSFRIRKEILDRVTGGCSSGSASSSTPAGTSPAGEGGGAEGGRKFDCYGEGWMGAGSWYILIAKINSELSTLINAESSGSEPEFRSALVDLGWFKNYKSVFGNSASQIRATAANEESGLVLQRYNDIYQSAARELAALGSAAPTALFVELKNQSDDSLLRDSDLSNLIKGVMKDSSRSLIDFFDPSNTSSGDPMFGLINLGYWLIIIGTGILVASVFGSVVSFGGAAVALLPIYSVLLAAGVTLSFILPVMPFLYWILAITGYLLIIVEAVIAVNLWALGHMRMDGEGISGEQGRQGWLMILSIFMTPTLMVFGFIVGMIIFRVGSDLISAGMFYAVSMLIGGDPITWLLGTVGFSVLIAATYVILLERSFSLVSEFPNKVLRWIGSNTDLTGGERAIQIATGAAVVGINQAGNALEKGAAKAREKLKDSLATPWVKRSNGRNKN